MLSKEFLLKEGFKHNPRAVDTVFEFEKEINGGYISVRFDGNTAVGLYVYTDGPKDINIRKVVLSETIVTKQDYELVKQLCRVK